MKIYLKTPGVFACLLVSAGLSATVVLAADIDVLDKQQREIPAPRSQPPLRIVEDGGETAGPDESLRFVLDKLTVVGAGTFSSDELTAPYREHYGRETSFARIGAIAGEMTRRYRDAGYLFSRVVVPVDQGALDPQHAEVRLMAIEGFISRVDYEGDADLIERLKAYWGGVEARLTEMRPLRHADFEREMLLLSDVPGLSVSSRFEEGAGEGATVLVLTARQRLVEFSLNAGNTGTESAGRGLVTANASLNHPFFLGGRTTLGFTQAAHRREYASVSLSHAHRFANGLTASFSWTKSDSPEPDSDFARRFDYETASETVTAGVDHSFIRGRDLNLSAGVSYEHRDSRSDLSGERYTRDRLRGLTVEANLDFSDGWGDGGVTQIVPTYTRGLSWASATDRDPDASASIAPARFNRLKLYLSHNRSLPGDFSLFAAAEAQFADESLSSYYRYALGGSQFGRGYASGEVENDEGYAFSLEGRWNTTLAGWSVSPFVFFDIGKVWARHGQGRDRVASHGIGFRLSADSLSFAAGRFSLTTFAARADKDAGEVDAGDVRYMLQAVYGY
jgi:hemolysin activation/secretion protein